MPASSGTLPDSPLAESGHPSATIDLGNKTLNDARDQLRGDYKAAKQTRIQRKRASVSSTGRTADYHYAAEAAYFYVMELSRDIMRNDLMVPQGFRRLVNNIVQDGFALDVQTGDQALDADLAALWKDWSEDADRCYLAGEDTFQFC